ncbi:MAG: chromate transporter [Chloroflexi bacterium]|nr:chromate transporter [Chloroflexota bacterium]
MKKPRILIKPRVTVLPSRFLVWLKLFWMFLKINLLTSSGPASVGLLYKDAVGHIMTEAQFVEAVGFSNVLPGSEALKLAMFVGFAAGGFAGTLAALLGSILPPTVSMLIVTLAVQHFEDEPWMNGFVHGMVPAVAMLITVAAWKLFRGSKKIRRRPLLIAALSLAALLLGAPTPLVLLGAGVLGVILFR